MPVAAFAVISSVPIMQSLTVVRFFVRVPILSEQIVLTDPRVSTVFSDLHKILFFFIIEVVIVKLAVTLEDHRE